jgi:beta-lactamase family protein
VILTAPPPPAPVIDRPAAYEVSYGVISGRAAPGAVRLVVRVDGRVVRDVPLERRRFSLQVHVPVGERTVRVVTVDRDGRRAARSIPHVLALPAASQPRFRTGRVDQGLAKRLQAITRGYPGTSAFYVQSLTSGAGASWNAGASFPAASTLKLAIAVTALARTDGKPRPGSTLDGLLRRMLWYSDNAAANAVERYMGGSTSGGSSLVNAMMRSIGLVDTEMYGGYVIGTRTLSGDADIPVRVDEQPSWGIGKRTSAHDLAGLARAVWLAGAGLGPLHRAQPAFTPADARYVLYLLAHVHDPGKIDRQVRRVEGVVVAHKAGWVDSARHDAGLVFWGGGVYVVSVMTYRAAGAGVSSDVLAGRIAKAALDRFRG